VAPFFFGPPCIYNDIVSVSFLLPSVPRVAETRESVSKQIVPRPHFPLGVSYFPESSDWCVLNSVVVKDLRLEDEDEDEDLVSEDEDEDKDLVCEDEDKDKDLVSEDEDEDKDLMCEDEDEDKDMGRH